LVVAKIVIGMYFSQWEGYLTSTLIEYNRNAGLPFPIAVISLHVKFYEIKQIDFQVKTALIS